MVTLLTTPSFRQLRESFGVVYPSNAVAPESPFLFLFNFLRATGRSKDSRQQLKYKRSGHLPYTGGDIRHTIS